MILRHRPLFLFSTLCKFAPIAPLLPKCLCVYTLAQYTHLLNRLISNQTTVQSTTVLFVIRNQIGRNHKSRVAAKSRYFRSNQKQATCSNSKAIEEERIRFVYRSGISNIWSSNSHHLERPRGKRCVRSSSYRLYKAIDFGVGLDYKLSSAFKIGS